MNQQISVAIITKNEENNIARCIDSVNGVADEIVVLDSLSSDQTVSIARYLGAKVFEQKFLGYIEQKNKAIDFCKFKYVLSLDADEALSPELKEELIKLKQSQLADAYEFHRLNFYCGKEIKHCGWYPDKRIRLFHKEKGKWAGDNPHDTLTMTDGSLVHTIAKDIHHYSFNSIDEHKAQADHFSTIAAKVAFNQGKKSFFIRDIIGNPLYTFIQKYILKLGFLDGYYGLVISVLSAYSNYLKYSKLKRLQNGA